MDEHFSHDEGYVFLLYGAEFYTTTDGLRGRSVRRSACTTYLPSVACNRDPIRYYYLPILSSGIPWAGTTDPDCSCGVPDAQRRSTTQRASNSPPTAAASSFYLYTTLLVDWHTWLVDERST